MKKKFNNTTLWSKLSSSQVKLNIGSKSVTLKLSIPNVQVKTEIKEEYTTDLSDFSVSVNLKNGLNHSLQQNVKLITSNKSNGSINESSQNVNSGNGPTLPTIMAKEKLQSPDYTATIMQKDSGVTPLKLEMSDQYYPSSINYDNTRSRNYTPYQIPRRDTFTSNFNQVYNDSSQRPSFEITASSRLGNLHNEYDPFDSISPNINVAAFVVATSSPARKSSQVSCNTTPHLSVTSSDPLTMTSSDDLAVTSSDHLAVTSLNNPPDLEHQIEADVTAKPASTIAKPPFDLGLPCRSRRGGARRGPSVQAIAAAEALQKGDANGEAVAEYNLMRARNNLAVRRCRARSRFLRIKLCEELRIARHQATTLTRQLREEQLRVAVAERQRDLLRQILREARPPTEDELALMDDDEAMLKIFEHEMMMIQEETVVETSR